MSKTRTQLANRALEKLRVVGLGQSPEAEDTETVDGVIDSFAEFLTSTTPPIYTIADLSDIEESAFEWLADYLAYFVAQDFQKVQDDGIRQRAEYMLRRLTTSGPTFETLRAEYF